MFSSIGFTLQYLIPSAHSTEPKKSWPSSSELGRSMSKMAKQSSCLSSNLMSSEQKNYNFQNEKKAHLMDKKRSHMLIAQLLKSGICKFYKFCKLNSEQYSIVRIVRQSVAFVHFKTNLQKAFFLFFILYSEPFLSNLSLCKSPRRQTFFLRCYMSIWLLKKTGIPPFV